MANSRVWPKVRTCASTQTLSAHLGRQVRIFDSEKTMPNAYEYDAIKVPHIGTDDIRAMRERDVDGWECIGGHCDQSAIELYFRRPIEGTPPQYDYEGETLARWHPALSTIAQREADGWEFFGNSSTAPSNCLYFRRVRA